MRKRIAVITTFVLLAAALSTASPRAAAHGTHGISVQDVTKLESAAPPHSFALKVTPAPDVGEIITVNFATSDGTATAADSDYAPTSGTAIFDAAGNATVPLTVNGDSRYENNETFFLDLSGGISNVPGTTVNISDGRGQFILVNDDPPPVVSISGPATVAEGTGGLTSVTYAVALSPPSGLPATVAFTTTNGTASAPDDYEAQAGTLAFAPGETSKPVVVQVVGETVFEPDEAFSVDLSTPSNATLGTASAETTISNDDTPATAQFSISDASVEEGNIGFTTFTFKVALSHTPVPGPATVQVATADGTAHQPSDYVAKSGTLTFAAAGTQDFEVQVVGDTSSEATERFVVDLSSPGCAACPVGTFADAQGQGTIVNDDGVANQPENQIDVNDASTTEGSAATFSLSRGSPCPAATSVQIPFDTRSFADGQPSGSATEGTDYPRTTGSVVLGAGQSSATFSVNAFQDDTDESDETFFVFLGTPTGTCTSSIDDGQGRGTIVDDDDEPAPTPPGNVVITGERRVVRERNLGTRFCRVPVTLSRSSTQAVTVKFATRDSTATAGEDYVATSGTLTFAPGVTKQKAAITVNGDRTSERPRRQRIFLDLTEPTGGATIGKSPAKCVIRDERRG